ncbi:hypothetical protein OBBRIDRAFT_508289 [Obba rivulosa]|uniref:Uncharacterized protein n=1 Tax=Obba rivulosa TaxID=1052685 RepID=A0A8E2B4S4_9APHY|nr:hypothetical protein OBBRIDRAFT_508289 [Obba rivulosa]
MGYISAKLMNKIAGLTHERYRLAERKLRRQTLLSCALICRVFSEPALDVLWRAQEGLDSLLAILREEVGLLERRTSQKVALGSKSYSSRSREFARRVANFTLDTYYWNSLDPKTVDTFLAHLGSPLPPTSASVLEH